MTAPGWTPSWEAARRAVDPDAALTPVRIAAEHRGAYHAIDSRGTGWVEVSGKDFHAAADKRSLPTVGDYVLVERWDAALAGNGAGMVRAILPRASFLVRKAAGEATLPQPLAANIDLGLVITSANADLSPARLDRYLALLRDGGIAPAFVLSKIDLVADPAPMLARLREIADIPIVPIAATVGTNLDAIRALGGPGSTSVLLGSSGVGKSTLLNAIAGTTQLTRGIRDDERGRHTTTRRELFTAPDGASWIDTPGMRELAQWVDDATDLDDAFVDLAALAATCRFRDCKHHQEPGCAVRDAIAPHRLASYHKLSDERRDAGVKKTEQARIAETRRAHYRKDQKKKYD